MKNIEIANKWFSFFNEKNLEGLLELYAENAEHFSPKLKVLRPETGGFIKGKTELKKWWQDAFTRLPTLFYSLNYFIADENKIFFEYVRIVNGEERTIVGEVLFFENGKISASKVFHT